MAGDIEQFIKEQGEETRRHFDVVAEDLKSEIQTVAEQVGNNTERITEIQEKLEEHDKKFESLEATLEVIKLDVEFIKSELKQKVSRDEFTALEKRLSMLEIKFNQNR